MTIEEAIKKSGTTNIMAKGSTKKAQTLIEKNEDVFYAINTNIIVEDRNSTLLKKPQGMFSITNGMNGVVVVTNKRIIFCNSTLGNSRIKQMAITEINSIDENINGLTKMGQLRVQGLTETFVINVYKSKICNELRASIYRAQEMQKQNNNIVSNSNVSNADEILKYKKLLDEGIITQEEFERKKQQLLK